ncbi:MAG: PilZ domain-containing protein [Planctomycetota bacterium]
MQTTIEQRKDSRSSVSWPVSVWIPEANRFVNGRSCNISKTGVFITLPATAPVGTGHLVELNFPRTEALAEEKGQFARIKTGKVVRVERKSLLESAEIGLGIASRLWLFFARPRRTVRREGRASPRTNGSMSAENPCNPRVSVVQFTSWTVRVRRLRR